jgi:hypothetical protein
MGVDDDPDGEGSERPKVGNRLVRLAMADPRVDEEDAGIAEHDPDVLVVERVSPGEDTVAELNPRRHGAQRSRLDAYHRVDDVIEWIRGHVSPPA